MSTEPTQALLAVTLCTSKLECNKSLDLIRAHEADFCALCDIMCALLINYIERSFPGPYKHYKGPLTLFINVTVSYNPCGVLAMQ